MMKSVVMKNDSLEIALTLYAGIQPGYGPIHDDASSLAYGESKRGAVRLVIDPGKRSGFMNDLDEEKVDCSRSSGT